jgi:hypothetical protein
MVTRRGRRTSGGDGGAETIAARFGLRTRSCENRAVNHGRVTRVARPVRQTSGGESRDSRSESRAVNRGRVTQLRDPGSEPRVARIGKRDGVSALID